MSLDHFAVLLMRGVHSEIVVKLSDESEVSLADVSLFHLALVVNEEVKFSLKSPFLSIHRDNLLLRHLAVLLVLLDLVFCDLFLLSASILLLFLPLLELGHLFLIASLVLSFNELFADVLAEAHSEVYLKLFFVTLAGDIVGVFREGSCFLATTVLISRFVICDATKEFATHLLDTALVLLLGIAVI